MASAIPSDAAERLEYRGILLDFAAYKVIRDGVPIHLGLTELRILRCLLAEPGRVFTRGDLLAAAWHDSKARDLRIVDGHIVRLRKALNRTNGNDAIRTVRRTGYTIGL